MKRRSFNGLGVLIALCLVLAGAAADAVHHHGHAHGGGGGVSLLAHERGGGDAHSEMDDAHCGLCIFIGLRNYTGDSAAVFLHFGEAARCHRDEPGDPFSALSPGLKSPRSPPVFLS